MSAVFEIGGKIPSAPGGLVFGSGSGGGGGGGFDGSLAINSNGLVTNGGGTPIMLRGGNIAGLQDQEIVDGNLFGYTGAWGSQNAIGGAPQFGFLSQQKLNAIRLNINAQSFQNTQSQSLVWGGSLGASSWGGTNIPGDPSGQYRATILQSTFKRAHIACTQLWNCMNARLNSR